MGPSSPSDSPSTSTKAASKRHSLLISTGPRPLRLLDNSPTPQGPSTAPIASGFDFSSSSPLSSSRSPPPISSRPSSRRQSSISYISKDRNYERDPDSRSPGLRHSLIYTPKSESAESSPKERKSVVIDVEERSPMTIVEQHSELLRSIAQKEAMCLELRSQLTTHEAELFQLKRKWERIMNRGLESTTSPALNAQGTMLDGIKEGVQGVSRLVAGLALGESSPVPQSPAVPIQPLRSSPRPTHASSNSSISTYATKSTRFSQSSTSSIGEELPSSSPPVHMTASLLSSNGSVGSSSDENVLIVRDTGATPVMSPNPAFIAKQQRREERRQRALQDPFTSSFGADLHRRKSRDGNKSPSPLCTPEHDSGRASPRSVEEDSVEEERRRRRSVVMGSFPPIAAIPGLTSLMTGTTTPPVSSWVGKKFEELQKGSTFTRSQKRASLLLSDVSQTIASVLSPSPLPANPTSTAPSAKSPAPSCFSPLSSSALPSCTTANSLLDDDLDDLAGGSFMNTSPVMTPEIKPSLARKELTSTTLPSTPHLRSPAVIKTKKEDDDEWNW